MIDTEKRNALADYIKKYRAQGFSDEALRGFLLKRGYSQEIVNAAFQRTGVSKSVVVAALVVATLGVIIAGLILLLPGAAKDCGNDVSCFFTSANSCESAVVEQSFGSAVFRYTADNCVLAKEVVAFDPREPQEVIDLFRGKSMYCVYERGALDPVLLGGLTAGLEKCAGPLADAILDLRAAQLKLQG